MSDWTHLIGAIHYDYMKEPFNQNEKEKLKLRMEELLKEAPPITGSEGNANIFVNVNPDITLSSSPELDYCEGCKYFNEEKGNCTLSFVDQLDCPRINFCSRVVITLQGDLRNKGINSTVKEAKAFLEFIQNIDGGYIRDKSIIVTTGYRTETITL